MNEENNNVVENNTVENNTVENNTVENNAVENNTVENNTVENNAVENNVVNNNVQKPKKNNTTLLIILALVLVIGVLCFLFFATDIFKSKDKENKKENTEDNVVLTPQEKKETYKDYTGIYQNGNSLLKLYYLEQGDFSLIYYDLVNESKNSEFSSYFEVNQIVGGTIKDKIFDSTANLTFSDGTINVETNVEDFNNGKYTKKEDYTENAFYEDHYGDPTLLKNKYCGVYSLDDKKLLIYQMYESELTFVIVKNNQSEFSSSLSLENATEDTIEGTIFTLSDVDIVVKLTYTEDSVTFNINGDDYQNYVGTYKRVSDITPHDILSTY
jgi:hypothetical protein